MIPGHSSDQEARCAALGKYDRTSALISEMKTAAARGPDPRDRLQQVPGGAKGLHHLLGLRDQLDEHGFQVAGVVQVQPAQEGMMVTEQA